MSSPQSAVRAIHCDGCTLEAAPEHLRRRIARLEWASRFRPIRIATLFVMPAPAASVEDFFYFPEGKPHHPAALALFEDVLESCGVNLQAVSREAALAKFQQQGCFLTEAIECPLDPAAEAGLDALIERLTPTIVRRIRSSYRPKSVLLLSERLAGLAKSLANAGLETEPLLWQGGPVACPEASDAQSRRRFRDQVSTLLGDRGPATP